MDTDRACSGLWNDNVVRHGLATPRKLWSKGGSDSGPTIKILSMSEDTMESLHGKASHKHEMPADAPPMSAPCQSRDTPAALGVTEVVLGCLADGRALKRQQSIACVRYGARTVGRAPSTAVVLSRPLWPAARQCPRSSSIGPAVLGSRRWVVPDGQAGPALRSSLSDRPYLARRAGDGNHPTRISDLEGAVSPSTHRPPPIPPWPRSF